MKVEITVKWIILGVCKFLSFHCIDKTRDGLRLKMTKDWQCSMAVCPLSLVLRLDHFRTPGIKKLIFKDVRSKKGDIRKTT